MDEKKSEQTYAERVIAMYDKTKKSLGEDEAKYFNEFVRGASLLDEDKKLLSKIESLDTNDLEAEIKRLKEIMEGMKNQFNATSVYEAFENVRKAGRTKLKLWRDGVYEDVLVNKEDESILPWAGEIKFGGPNRSITGIVTVNDYDISLGDEGISINGHLFNDVVRYIDQTIPEISNEQWGGRHWDGRWVLARDEGGLPLRGGPQNSMYLRKVSS